MPMQPTPKSFSSPPPDMSCVFPQPQITKLSNFHPTLLSLPLPAEYPMPAVPTSCITHACNPTLTIIIPLSPDPAAPQPTPHITSLPPCYHHHSCGYLWCNCMPTGSPLPLPIPPPPSVCSVCTATCKHPPAMPLSGHMVYHPSSSCFPSTTHTHLPVINASHRVPLLHTT